MQIHYQPARGEVFPIHEHVYVDFGEVDLRVGQEPDGRIVLFGYEGDNLVASITLSPTQAAKVGRTGEAVIELGFDLGNTMVCIRGRKPAECDACALARDCARLEDDAS